MFTALIHRDPHSAGWQKIPWHDPDFSRRMLAEHLDQSHDMASRRASIIDQHVAWIHHEVLRDQPARILDLGCGPGLYTRRLTALGHTCIGVDISPASLEYAREHDPITRYTLGDVRTIDFGSSFDVVMMVFGELNAFAPEEAAQILRKAYEALKPGGTLLLEVHPVDVVQREGQKPPAWYSAESGLFSDQPFVCLMESMFDGSRAATHFYVISAQTGAIEQYATMLQAYTDEAYRQLLNAFDAVTFYPSLTGSAETGTLFVITARKP